MKIWLDNKRPHPLGWTWCPTVETAWQAFLQVDVEAISFDYDLDDGQPTGLWFAHRIIACKLVPPVVQVHSANRLGGQAIVDAFEMAGYPVERITLGREKDRIR